MTIRNRLKLIGLVPIILLILLSSYFFITSYLSFEKANALKITLINNAAMNKALLSIGKERGLTALYLGSDKKKFADALIKQRERSDKIFKNTRYEVITDYSTYLPVLIELLGEKSTLQENKSFGTFFANVDKLAEVRKKIDTEDVDFKDIFFTTYTKSLATPVMNKLISLKSYSLDTEISSLIATLLQLYTAKENTELERGFISYYMSKKSSISFDEIVLWDYFKTKANVFDIKQVTNPLLRKELEKLLNNTQSIETMGKIAMTSFAIQSNIDNGNYKEEVVNWFALQTKKITLLSKAELIVSNVLWNKSEVYRQRQLLLLSIASAIWILALILGYLGYTTTRDITRNIKELVETEKDAKRIALKANEAKSLFLANMSHEIRTPLNGIVGFTEILRSTELTEEQDEFLAIIDKSSENLLSIINNILDLSKIESNKVEIENIVFDAAEEFESAVETYAVAATEKNIDLNYYMDPMISAKLKGDPTKIKGIIINLLSNAVKFTSYGGEINLLIKKIILEDETSCIHFSVQDSGIGMTKDQQSLIFDAFSQADVSVTRKFGGTGLGLTISSQFVALMGGKLELKSVKDQGTTFFFSLPLEEIISTGINYADAFDDLTIGKYAQDIPTKLDNYLEDYFKYFGLSVKHFESIAQLKELDDNKICKSYWIDIDKAKQNIREAIPYMDKSKLIIMANVSSRNKLKKLGLNQNNVIYKPVTLNKLKTVLSNTANITPQLTEKSISTQQTKFNAHVLVTEDNIMNQNLIKRILEKHGITVDLANNGLESLEKRRSGKYDLLFMDIQMPVMDGIEATHEILHYEEDEALAHIPIIALTSNALKDDRERFLVEGMDEYLPKPLKTAELLYILNKFLADKANTNASAKKKILIAKKFLLARRVLAKVLENIGQDYEILDDVNTLKETLASGDYDLLFVDANLITEEIIINNKNIAIIASTDTNNLQTVAVTLGENISNTASKEELENIIKKYRG